MSTTIQLRRGTAANWTSTDPTLAAGEGGFETDTGKLKIGDGSTAWTGLAYIGGSGGGVTTTGSPASGNLTKFSGATSITNADLTGDVTTSGTVAATIANDAVTFAKMQNIATDSLIGRDTASTGDPENILLNATLSMDGAGNLQRAALTGDVTASAGSNSTTIPNDTVTYAKMQNVSAASRVLGRGSSAGSGDVQELTVDGTSVAITGTVISAVSGGAGLNQLTGDVTAGPGVGSQAATIPNDTVTYAKMQNVSAASRLLGRGSAGGAGDVEELTVGGALSISATVLSTNPAGGADPRSSIYNPFSPSGVDDEFSDGSFTGWTLVDDGLTQPVVTEVNDMCSLLLPGGDSADRGHAYMKSTTVNTNDIIEMAFRGYGRLQNFNFCGLMMADGVTYGAGKQLLWALSPAESGLDRIAMTNYNTNGGGVNYVVSAFTPVSDVFLRLKYLGSNNWQGFGSADGTSWVDFTAGGFATTLTPTAVGFFVSTWGGAFPYNWSIRYFRKTT